MKSKVIRIFMMSEAYEMEEFIQPTDEVLDCRTLRGTNSYLDDVAKKKLEERLKKEPVEGIHFLDSGNYHYLTLLWMKKIQRDFSLILWDNHPDMQPPAFGKMISCGDWIYEALEYLPHLKHVYMQGVDEKLIEALQPLPEKITVVDPEDEKIQPDRQYPVYISVDKDVLSKQDARCNWTQGVMQLQELENRILYVDQHFEVIAMDFCGEAEDDEPMEEHWVNAKTNQKLRTFIEKKL